MTNEEAAKESFERNTAAHEMVILHDEGVYRNVRFQTERSSFYYYDLVTWPGHLVISGDCGSYLFSRITDMFDFFQDNGYGINPGYWSEKLRAPKQENVRVYSYDLYRQLVKEWASDKAQDMDAAEAESFEIEVHRELLSDMHPAVHDEHEAFQALRDFNIQDYWDWDLRDYDFQFLWCCWAIVKGIERYKTAKELVA